MFLRNRLQGWFFPDLPTNTYVIHIAACYYPTSVSCNRCFHPHDVQCSAPLGYVLQDCASQVRSPSRLTFSHTTRHTTQQCCELLGALSLQRMTAWLAGLLQRLGWLASLWMAKSPVQAAYRYFGAQARRFIAVVSVSVIAVTDSSLLPDHKVTGAGIEFCSKGQI